VEGNSANRKAHSLRGWLSAALEGIHLGLGGTAGDTLRSLRARGVGRPILTGDVTVSVDGSVSGGHQGVGLGSGFRRELPGAFAFALKTSHAVAILVPIIAGEGAIEPGGLELLFAVEIGRACDGSKKRRRSRQGSCFADVSALGLSLRRPLKQRQRSR